MYISKDPKRYETIRCLNCRRLTSKYFRSDFRKIKKFCDNPCYWEWKAREFRGENTYNWKGDKAKHAAKHHWMRKHFGNANECWGNNCNKKSHTYEWANIDHKYKRNAEDWVMLCCSCHHYHDLDKFGTRKNNGRRHNESKSHSKIS